MLVEVLAWEITSTSTSELVRKNANLEATSTLKSCPNSSKIDEKTRLKTDTAIRRQKMRAKVAKVTSKWPQGSPRAPKMEPGFDQNLLKIRSGAGLGQYSSDSGVQGCPRHPFQV